MYNICNPSCDITGNDVCIVIKYMTINEPGNFKHTHTLYSNNSLFVIVLFVPENFRKGLDPNADTDSLTWG